MSSETRRTLIEDITRSVMRWQDATQAFDEVVGARLDLGTAERHCIGFLHAGPRPAGAIADAVGLTPAAITSLIDRLEARGLVERRKNANDRRQILVALTPAAVKAGARYYGPIAKDGEALLGKMSTAELEIVRTFLADVLALQQRHTDRIRSERGKPRRE